MGSAITDINERYKKYSTVRPKSGDTVKVSQKIREGNKERIQHFQGLVIKTSNPNNQSSRIYVRKISAGIGVEKSFLIHSPLITKIEIIKRSKVRRNYLSYMRTRTGKSARLSAQDFDRQEVNFVDEAQEIDKPSIEEAQKEETKE